MIYIPEIISFCWKNKSVFYCNFKAVPSMTILVARSGPRFISVNLARKSDPGPLLSLLLYENEILG